MCLDIKGKDFRWVLIFFFVVVVNVCFDGLVLFMQSQVCVCVRACVCVRGFLCV